MGLLDGLIEVSLNPFLHIYKTDKLQAVPSPTLRSFLSMALLVGGP